MHRFVVIEGLIGVGKTTLCRLLHRRRQASLILEPHEDNPFLESFYENPERYAMPVQMYYLLTRWRQQERIRQISMFEPWVVSDYLFVKDRIFAEMTLSEEELGLYDQFSAMLGRSVPTPDLVIALDAPTDVLLSRIKRRNMPGEHHITRDYLDDLRSRYHKLWSRWSDCPVLHVDNQQLDYSGSVVAQDEILRRIDVALSGGTVDPAPGSVSDREDALGLFD
ncbi:MAG: deoxynucleoside kinase [Myxococcota bacterium]